MITKSQRYDGVIDVSYTRCATTCGGEASAVAEACHVEPQVSHTVTEVCAHKGDRLAGCPLGGLPNRWAGVGQARHRGSRGMVKDMRNRVAVDVRGVEAEGQRRRVAAVTCIGLCVCKLWTLRLGLSLIHI